MQSYLRILTYLRPYRGRILLGICCLLVATPLSLVHPWIWKYIVDEVVMKRQPGLLAPTLLLMMALHGSGAALNAVQIAESLVAQGLLGGKAA